MQNQTQVSIVKVMDRGLLVIPKKIREKAEVFKGSYIKIIYKNGQIILEPLVDQFTNKPLKKPKRDLILRKAKYSKKERFNKIMSIGKIKWTKEDDEFLAEGRRQIEDRLNKYDKLLSHENSD
ncbi:hypothetical protein A2954_01325 [Candidatus Roizmanbacteria bacterium RIFCSPLOWO2_01_FULL_37_12]|uniref:SpoVT-AbrB domain-containing protein n=1 Tax=Candidatus Roizmanbacteria bacterium RIFCSPLOWO2_01_FULL_37_12 TaxID=1802056 RepID=A0A1F7IGH6_9BACT|nr:MAG: hypothetical protein A3D76_05965 [Candidatus Roizmanbacteria bacterium RIFCSPHIGHO2_02_FULL_37_9b]OGK42466.1 MAG: hypothetical protein A2954_01325 [Candidatus Roizmanbacteria bacterium RIFCSPLOWO2_01_FULL_37_12]